MLRVFARRNKAFFLEMADLGAAQGWEGYLWAGADGEAVPPTGLLSNAAPTPAQIAGKEEPPEGWFIVPVHAANQRIAGFVGACAPGDDMILVQLESQAALLSQLLTREGELDSMTAELMGAYDLLVAMYNISQATRSNLKRNDILRSLIDQALNLSSSQESLVVIEELDELVSVYPAAHPKPQKGLMQSLLRAVRELNRPVLCNDRSDVQSVLEPQHEGLERCVAVPVSVQGDVVACLALLNKPDPYTAGDQKLLVALADEAAAIIERDRFQTQLLAQERMRRELEIAAEIQAGLLPSELPTVPGLELAAHSRPAMEVGGDFYDVVQIPEGPLAMVLGDVTGKGVPAALFATVAHNILHHAIPQSSDPRAVLDELNADLYDELTNASMFITLHIAFFDPSTGQLVMVNAGHAPVLYYEAAAGRARLLEADGPPVGVLPQVLSEIQTVVAEPGDILAVLSDGFSEMTGPDGEMFGIDPLMRLMEENADQSAAALQDCLLDAVSSFAQGMPQPDDLTICVLKSARD